MIFDNQLRHAVDIITRYQGDEPLHIWLKSFFRDNKQMGSRDRKQLSSLVYSFYRLGHTLRDQPIPNRILVGLFLCSDQPSDFLQHFHPIWNEAASQPLDKKITFLQTQPEGESFELRNIFPWKDELSDNIDHEAFCSSFLKQPDLFLRIRPGHETTVMQKVKSIGQLMPPFTLRLPNGFKVEEQFTPDHEVVIQDYSSQRLADFLQGATPPQHFWDTCAASGGKSILAHDLYPNMEITASDIREPILNNLKQRFRTAGIKNYHTLVADLTKGSPDAFPYDLVLADVPCTGSGTWSRTPEECYFFNPQKIKVYHDIQRSIIQNVLSRLEKDTRFVYSTCSVFKKENETIAALIGAHQNVQQQKMENIKGYHDKADTMFAASFLIR